MTIIHAQTINACFSLIDLTIIHPSRFECIAHVQTSLALDILVIMSYVFKAEVVFAG